MEESLEDIRMLTSQYGPLTEDNLYVDESDQTVLISYKGDTNVASLAAAGLDGTVIRGQINSAKILSECSFIIKY